MYKYIAIPNTPKTNVRSMNISDVETVVHIQQECRLSHWTIAGYEQELDRLDSIALVAELNNQVVGFLTSRLLSADLNIIENDSIAEAEILNFGIKENFRKQGIGDVLFRAFLSTARARQTESIWLEVRASNRNAISFYKNRGFIEIQRRKNFYAMPVEDAVVMKLPLPKAIEQVGNNFS